MHRDSKATRAGTAMPAVHPPSTVKPGRKRSWRRLLARVGAFGGTLLLAGAMLLLIFGNAMLDGYGKRRVERAFAAAHPGLTLHIGKMHYSPGVNRLVAAPVILRSTNATLQADWVSLTGVRWARLLWGTTPPVETLAAAGLEVTNIRVDFAREHYGIRCSRLRASGPDAELAAEGTELRMLMSDEEFFAANVFRATRFRVVIPQCTVVGLAFGELLRGRSWRAQSVHFSGPTFDALVNCDKPADPFAPLPLMVHEALAAIRQPLQIDRLSITNGRITYRERMVAGADPGVLTFGDVSVSAEGIANHGTTTSSVEVAAQGNLMDAGLLKLRMTIPVAPTNFSFHYSGSLGAMDLTRLGAFLDIAEATRIKSGSVETALFEIAVNDGEAHGRVHAIYRDLVIALLDPETGSETGWGNRFASFLTNLLKIQNSSPPAAAGAMKAGAVNYSRSPDEEFLQFAWFALRTGVLDVISQ